MKCLALRCKSFTGNATIGNPNSVPAAAASSDQLRSEPCGSASTARVLPLLESPAAKYTELIVFPVPPFRLHTVILNALLASFPDTPSRCPATEKGTSASPCLPIRCDQGNRFAVHLHY